MTSAPMTVRDATRADLTTIVAIYNAAIPGRMATADTAPVPPQSRQVWFEEHDPARRPLWVACVEPGQRRGGIGRALLGRAVETAPGLGLKTLVGFVFGHNEPSLRLFAGFGFQRWALLPGVAELDGIER